MQSRTFGRQSLGISLVSTLVVLLCSFTNMTPAFGVARQDLIALKSNDGHIPGHLTLVFGDGPVHFNHIGQSIWKPTTCHQTLIDGDAIRTGDHGYAVIAFSTDNLILLKPRTAVRFAINPALRPAVIARIHRGTLMISIRESNEVLVETERGSVMLLHGDASVNSYDDYDQIKAMLGNTVFHVAGAAAPVTIPEAFTFRVEHSGIESDLTQFDVRMEYDSFRRFNTWIRNFDSVQRSFSTHIDYKVSDTLINGRFLKSYDKNRDGFIIIDPGAQPAPESILIQVKIFPYPRIEDRFELYLHKDLVYPLREGRDGYFEALIPTPDFPEFFAKIHHVDQAGRRDRIFDAKFVIFNRQKKIEEAKAFLDRLTMAFTRRDTIFLRDNISRDYRDWFGNTYFDFIRMLEDTFRQYRDTRLILHPHTFVFKKDLIQVNMNYRLTALAGDWSYRFEDRGAELMTLVFENGSWKIRSKSRGLFFQRLKVANDLRLGILRGRVTDEFTGGPLKGAQVRILGTSMRTVTDSMGEYIIYNIPAGTYNVEITKNGYGKITISELEIKPSGTRG